MEVTGPTVNIASPSGGSWTRGSTQGIEWTTASYAGTTAKVELLSGTRVVKVVAAAARMTGASGTVSLIVPTTLPVGSYTVRVTLPGGATAQSATVTVT